MKPKNLKATGKHFGLLLVSILALSFNSHFAQAAKRSSTIFKAPKVYAYKKQNEVLKPIPIVMPDNIVVMKTGIRMDKNNVYIGGYLINTSKKEVKSVKVVPKFMENKGLESEEKQLVHYEQNISPQEVRRFVIIKPISRIKKLLEENIPLEEKCVLTCKEI